MYFPFGALSLVPQIAAYHKKLLARLLSLDTLGSMRHTEQALTRDELACCLADTVCLILNAHKGHLEVADEFSLALCE